MYIYMCMLHGKSLFGNIGVLVKVRKTANLALKEYYLFYFDISGERIQGHSLLIESDSNLNTVMKLQLLLVSLKGRNFIFSKFRLLS